MAKQRRGEDPTLGGHIGTGVTRAPKTKPPISDKTKGRDDGTVAERFPGMQVDRSSRAKSPPSEIGPGTNVFVDTTRDLTLRPPDEPDTLSGTDQPYEI
jgi:hypothetical protein